MGLLVKIIIGGIIGYFVLWILFRGSFTGPIMMLVVSLGLQYPALHISGLICEKNGIFDFAEKHKVIGYFTVLLVWGVVCFVLYGISAWLLMKLFF